MIYSTYEVICYRIVVVYIFSREGFQSESSSRIGKCRGSSDDLTEVNAARSLGRSRPDHRLVVSSWWSSVHAGGYSPPVLPLGISPGQTEVPADLLVSPGHTGLHHLLCHHDDHS